MTPPFKYTMLLIALVVALAVVSAPVWKRLLWEAVYAASMR